MIDDDVQIRRSLHFVLGTAGFGSTCFASAGDFLDSLPTLTPAPILIDVRMPEIDGLALMEILNTRDVKWPVIVMSAHAAIPVAVHSIKLGATDFLQKPFEFEALEASLHNAMSQLSNLQLAEASRQYSHDLFQSLSPREQDVMNVLIDGLSNKIAAYRLSLSVRTVEMHRANALVKLKVRSIAEVVRLARDAGIAAHAFK